jgi:hypothetical protein
MLLLAAASHHNAIMGTVDFPGAFLNATLERKQYMFLGKDATAALCTANGFYKKFVRANGTMMVRLGRALYGLPESGKRWYDCLSSFLVESGYVQSKTDNCIFSKVIKSCLDCMWMTNFMFPPPKLLWMSSLQSWSSLGLDRLHTALVMSSPSLVCVLSRIQLRLKL